eukprot:10783408-Alexandrium_andersonii.AAC.1
MAWARGCASWNGTGPFVGPPAQWYPWTRHPADGVAPGVAKQFERAVWACRRCHTPHDNPLCWKCRNCGEQRQDQRLQVHLPWVKQPHKNLKKKDPQ